MAGAPSTLDLPFYADLGFMAERGRNFFSKITRQRIRRGAFHSLVDLQAAINRYLLEHNADPKPVVWTASAYAILDKLNRLPEPSV